MIKKQILLSIVFIGLISSVYSQISIEDRYWKYKNEKSLLIGAWNHGHNPHIDHDESDANGSQGVSTEAQIKAAIAELADAGGNLLRCVLNPGMAAGIQNHNFCETSGSKYDLNTMMGPFWSRLDMFLAEAEAKGIVVQFEIWDRFDLIDGGWQSWPVSPFNPDNNINYTTNESSLANSYSNYNDHPFLQGVPGHPVYDAASADRKGKYDLVRSFQEKFVDQMLSITFQYDNVLYCMNNETHENPKWGEYWITYIRNKASVESKTILTTDMLDGLYEGVTSTGWQYQSNNLGAYDYIDVSQTNSRNRDQMSWDIIKEMADDAKSKDILLHMTKVYGSDLALNGAPWSSWKPGDTDNGIEEWWRNLIVGVAGIRFHRPTAGIGINDLAVNNIKAVRLIEEKVKFWDVEPHQELLGNRESDEAYVAANLGVEYILYFTAMGQGSVTLDLTGYSGVDFKVSWVNINTGSWDFSASTTISGGTKVPMNRPGAGHWVAAIVESSLDPKEDQMITVAEIDDKLTIDAPFEVVASTTSNLPLTYEVTGPATISGTGITLDGTAGMVTVTVSQVGDNDFNPAAAQQIFEVQIVTGLNIEPLSCIKLFPNPAHNHIQVSGDYDHIKVVSVYGIVVKQYSDGRKYIDVSDLSSGSYIAIIYTKSGAETLKFLKN